MLNLNDGFGVPNPTNSPTVAERPEAALFSRRRANWQRTGFDLVLAARFDPRQGQVLPPKASFLGRRQRMGGQQTADIRTGLLHLTKHPSQSRQCCFAAEYAC
jgi:hypothetical protein